MLKSWITQELNFQYLRNSTIKLKSRTILTSMYVVMSLNKKYEDTMNLLLIAEEKKKHYVLIKDFNKLMYNKTKHRDRKHFCMYCL